jgi:hypothetical protein
MKKVTILTMLVSGILSLLSSCNRTISIDDNLPAGNIIVEKMSGDTVYVKPDLRDTEGEWFYWAMRVRGAQGKTLVFKFPYACVGVRGAVVSLDHGKTFSFAGNEDRYWYSFTWSFGPKDKDVYFYECHPYLLADWERFVQSIDKDDISLGVLCHSREGKEVPFATLGRRDGQAGHRVVISARHHCSETMASFVMEGIAKGFLADNETGKWLRDNVELTIVPFIDYDGAMRGDQGKNRKPHDHNRDYTDFLYPETKALTEILLEKKPEIILDLHCPWIYGEENNEHVYNPLGDPAITPDAAAEERFAHLVEINAKGLPYKASGNIPFGTSWNTNQNYTQGLSSLKWARLNSPGARVCMSYEIPFANASGTEVNPESSRIFGESIATAIAAFFQ